MRRAGVGTQLEYDIWTEHDLESPAEITAALVAIAAQTGMVIHDILIKRYLPIGMSAVAVVAESHIFLHTWPELGFMCVDVFVCTGTIDARAINIAITDVLHPNKMTSREVVRGDDAFYADFVERDPGSPGSRVYQVSDLIDERLTGFQSVTIFDTPVIGRVLALDNIIQVATIDEYIYHELLVHPAMCLHPRPRNVLLIGGGDGHSLAQILRHDTVENVWVCELDPEVVALSRKAFPELGNVFDDPRIELLFGDAMETIHHLSQQIDVLISDMTDPLGQAARFFDAPFFRIAAAILGSDGVLSCQTESIHFHSSTVRDSFRKAGESFQRVAIASGAMASYPGAWWTFLVATQERDPLEPSRRPDLKTRFYLPSEHRWYFIPPKLLSQLLSQ